MHPHWGNDYAAAATSAGVAVPFDDAVTTVDVWVCPIAAAR
ncbi:hypothetical protein [Pengzhenrongella phosphoraccumulans]